MGRKKAPSVESTHPQTLLEVYEVGGREFRPGDPVKVAGEGRSQFVIKRIVEGPSGVHFTVWGGPPGRSAARSFIPNKIKPANSPKRKRPNKRTSQAK